MAETGLRRLMDEGRLKCVVVLAEELSAGLQSTPPTFCPSRLAAS